MSLKVKVIVHSIKKEGILYGVLVFLSFKWLIDLTIHHCLSKTFSSCKIKKSKKSENRQNHKNHVPLPRFKMFLIKKAFTW